MSASGGMSSMSCTPENSCIREPAHDMNIFREAVVQLTRRNYGLPGSGLSARVRWSGVRNTIHTSGPNLYPRVVQVPVEVWQPPIKRAELFVSTLTLMPDL